MTQTNGWRVWIQYYWCSCCLLQTIITATWVVESLIFSKGYTQDTPNGISFRKQSKVQLTPLATSPTFWHGNKTPSATNGVPGIAPNLKQICHTLPTERNLVTCHRLFFSLAVTCATKKLWQHTCWRIPFFFSPWTRFQLRGVVWCAKDGTCSLRCLFGLDFVSPGSTHSTPVWYLRGWCSCATWFMQQTLSREQANKFAFRHLLLSYRQFSLTHLFLLPWSFPPMRLWS